MKRKLKAIANKISGGLIAATGVRLLSVVARRFALTAASTYAIPVLLGALALSAFTYFHTEDAVLA